MIVLKINNKFACNKSATMKIILEIDVDDTTGIEYEHLAPENKQQFINAVSGMLKKTTINLRANKLKKLLAEIRKNEGAAQFDPEILYAILRNEEF